MAGGRKLSKRSEERGARGRGLRETDDAESLLG